MQLVPRPTVSRLLYITLPRIACCRGSGNQIINLRQPLELIAAVDTTSGISCLPFAGAFVPGLLGMLYTFCSFGAPDQIRLIYL